MRSSIHKVALCMCVIAAVGICRADTFNVKSFGAVGDGKALDSPAINKAVEAAYDAGGGIVYLPAGTYLCGSIRLKSNVTLQIGPGATIEATADPNVYDQAEPNEYGDRYGYQDYGHSHWHNSLIWAEGAENIAITGPGRIYGKGLTRSGPRRNQSGPHVGNKSIALKNCRNVTIRDLTVLQGGWFCILPTGVDNFTIENVRLDTNRDGINIDCCRNVRISNCSINSPFDDAIVLKSSFGLGMFRATENVTITNCLVSGYQMGSMLDGTFTRVSRPVPDRDGPTGRIKFGTESNGGFKNITISNCLFDHCRGLALETVDGGVLEDITISNITMRDIVNSPIFMRLGSRMRGPEGTPVGKLRRVAISNIVVYNADPRYCSIISGIPGHYIEDVVLTNIRIVCQGGGSGEDAARVLPEREGAYPEPSMFGRTPAYGFFIRHAKGLIMDNVQLSFSDQDMRPPFVLEDIRGIEFSFVRAQRADGVPALVLKDVQDLKTFQCKSLADVTLERVDRKDL